MILICWEGSGSIQQLLPILRLEHNSCLEMRALYPLGQGKTNCVADSVTRLLEGKIPRFLSKTPNFAAVLKRLRDFYGIERKIVEWKRGRKGQFLSKMFTI